MNVSEASVNVEILNKPNFSDSEAGTSLPRVNRRSASADRARRSRNTEQFSKQVGLNIFLIITIRPKSDHCPYLSVPELGNQSLGILLKLLVLPKMLHEFL